MRWVSWLGCAVILAIGATLIVWIGVQVLPITIGLLIAIALIAGGVRRSRRASAVRQFRSHYGSDGKDLLVVLTDSPHWRPYIEREWLSRWGTRAIVLNRSQPWSPSQPEAKLWNAFKGIEEHTPLAIVVPPNGKVGVFRFFKAFRDMKHGKDAKLREVERQLQAAPDASTSQT